MKRALLAGLALALVYLAGAAVSARLSPLARLPLLDGLAPPPPYRWVDPPSDLAAGNRPPLSGRTSVAFKGGRSEAVASNTRDTQLSLVLAPGALPPHTGAERATVEIAPLAASAVARPSGYRLDGNVYKLTLSYEPRGGRVEAFARPQQVVLVYPADASLLKPRHLVAASADGQKWRVLPSQDSPAQLTTTAKLPGPGFIAVVTPVRRTSREMLIQYVVVGVGILILGLIGWRVYVLSQRAAPSRPR